MPPKSPASHLSARELKSLFAAIAPRYDLANAVLSMGLHHLWNRSFCHCLAQLAPRSLLDLCAGTGAIGLRMGRLRSDLERITLADFCPQMLAIAKDRYERDRKKVRAKVTFVEADVQHLPPELSRGGFDIVSIAYGLRNIDDPRAALRGAWRALKPGGLLAILELTRPEHPLLQRLHRGYLKFLPALGFLVTRNARAYRHLSHTVAEFVSAKEMAAMGLQERFTEVGIRPLWGGLATILLLSK